MIDFIFNVTKGDVRYDCETFPNVFTVGFIHPVTRIKWLFEISDRRNDTEHLCNFICMASHLECRLFGFNNNGFDYPLLHFIYKNRHNGVSAHSIYIKAMSIINSHGPAKYAHMVWESDWLVKQVDLFKIHHFDNISKATSLKVLEFNMQMDSVEDLPFPVGTVLDSGQIDTLISYMWHDIDATDLFAERTMIQLDMRRRLSETFDADMTNMSDVKIGETILVSEMMKRGIACYDHSTGKKVKRQTVRASIDLNDVILPYIKLERPEFVAVMDYFKSKVITETKGVFKNLVASVDGVDYAFGTGGLHASVESQTICSNETHQLIDVDVARFYPSLGIANRLYPEHLGVGFCDAYEEVVGLRSNYSKDQPENGALKLAANGAYGGSNNKYSPLLDSKYTMTITINGQLSLCMLVEQLIKVPGLSMVQANTDGVTYFCPREYIEHTRSVCKWWEGVTKLELEEVLYKRMFIKDVNSYMAEKDNGSLKRIGAYAHVTAEQEPGTRELPYHKDWSHRVVALVAEEVLVRGGSAIDEVYGHDDVYDFFLRTKVPRSSSLKWGGETVANVVRYYISDNGKPLEKVMPPKGIAGEFKRANKLTDDYFDSIITEVGPGVWDGRIHTKNKSMYEIRHEKIHSGWDVKLCNDVREFTHDINYEWYVQQVEKLTEPLLNKWDERGTL